jgi:hypothetical protein
MAYRIVTIAAVAAALCGCTTTSDAGLWPGPPPDSSSPQTQLSERDECLAGCQAKYDRCSDDSAKERSDPGTSCYQDYRDCSEKCEAKVASDPASRVDQGVTVSEGGGVVIGNDTGNVHIGGPVTVISKGR